MRLPRSTPVPRSSPQVHRPRMRIGALCLVAAAAILTGCGNSDGPSTPDVPTVTPATASPAPVGPATSAAGLVVPTPADGRGLALSGDLIAVLDRAGTTVLRYRADDPGADPQPATTPELTQLIGSGGGAFFGVGPGVVVRIAGDGTVSTTEVDVDDPTALAQTATGEVLIGTTDGRVLVLDGELSPLRQIDGFVRVDDITVSPDGADLSAEQVVVLDRAQSSVTPVDVADGDLGPALRAGNGATNSAVDHFGRVLVANTRDGEIIGFFGSPLVMRFRYPVPGGPYAVDYDDERNLMWVSTTANNEVVAYDLSGGEPVEKRRVQAVAQPDSIVVDDTSGTLYVLSRRGGLQIVDNGG